MATQAVVDLGLRMSQELRIPMSFDEFLTLPDYVHAEWVDGEAIIFMPGTTVHSRIIVFLIRLLADFAEEFGLGEVLTAPLGMRLGPDGPFREPDILFVRAERRDRLDRNGIEGPADLVVELVSDDSVARNRAEKFYEFQEGGVPEYWIYDPRLGKERADFYRLSAEGKYEPIVPDAEGRLHSSVLRGFWVRLDWLRSDPLPPVKTALAEILASVSPVRTDGAR